MAELNAKPALRLDSKLYDRALRRWGEGTEGRVGKAPDDFLEWLAGHKIDQALISMFSKAIPLKPMERDGDYLNSPEGIILFNDDYPEFIESGLLILGAAMSCGDFLVMDLWQGGVIGIVDHERLDEPLRDEFWPVDKTIGRCAHRLAGTWWRTLIENGKGAVVSLLKQKAGPVFFPRGKRTSSKRVIRFAASLSPMAITFTLPDTTMGCGSSSARSTTLL